MIIPPRVVDKDADEDFRRTAALLNFDLTGQFGDRYVDWEWGHLRHALDLYVGDAKGRKVLEVGCHIGASLIVLATLGAEAIGIEISDGCSRLAELNLRRYGLADKATAILLKCAPPLPFADASFDLVCCNSVLEYVPHRDLCNMMKEISRVIRPGGILLILGTSNRLWPREIHSGRWFVNYIPRLFGRSLVRGIFPWELSLPGFCAIDRSGKLYLELHRRYGVKHKLKTVLIATLSLLARYIGMSPGRLGPNIFMVLRREGEQ